MHSKKAIGLNATSHSGGCARLAHEIMVGSCVGRVVRLLPNGIAVKFVEQQTVRDLERLVVRAVPVAVKVDAGLPEPVAARSAVMV